MKNIKPIFETRRYILFWDCISRRIRLYDKLNQYLIF